MKDRDGYAEGFALGRYMKRQRDAGDGSYDCCQDLGDAAKEPGDYFENFSQGLNDGFDTATPSV